MEATFADYLREAMGAMTQEQLAAASGLRQTTISKILNGADPRYSTVVALERALPNLERIRARRRKDPHGGPRSVAV